MATPPPPRSARGREGTGLPLRSYPAIALPVGQRIGGGGRAPAELVAAVTEALVAEGFRAETPLRPEPAPPAAVVVAERNLRRVQMQPAMRAAVWVLAASGAAIGVLDALIIGTWVILPLWFVAFALVGFLLWLRYGRRYESEMVLAIAVPTPPGGPAADLLLSAGRVRSLGYDGARTPIEVVDCPVPLMEGLASVVRRVRASAA